MKKLLTLLVSLILPGVGQILRGRIKLGVVFFICEVALLDALAYVAFQAEPPAPQWKAAVVMGGFGLIWLGCQAHLAYLLYGVDPTRHAERKELAFHEGLRYYVRDKLPDAIRQFESVIRIDSSDYDAHFYLGVCLSRAGARKRALRSFKKCIEYDDDRKWAEEIAEELRKLKQQHKGKREAGAEAG